MKKQKKSKSSINTEIDFSKGVRGKYAKKMRKGFSVTIYSPNKEAVLASKGNSETYIMIEHDLAKFFPDAQAVNSALRHLVAAMPSQTLRKKAA